MDALSHLDRVRGWLSARGWNLPEDWAEYEDMGDVLAITNVEQNTPEWQFLRCGLITASAVNTIVTPSRLEYGAGARRLLSRLLGEEILGEPYDWGRTGFTERGHEQEDHARKWYAVERGVEVRRVGFLLAKDGEEGGSPDGLVGEDGGVEIKCYGLEHHMAVVLGVDPFPENPGQIQGLLRLTGRAWWDMVAYNPNPLIPNRLERVYRDEEYIAAIEKNVQRAKREMAIARERLRDAGTARIDIGQEARPLSALSDVEIEQLRADVAEAQERGLLPKENAERLLGWVIAGKWGEVRDAWDALKKGLEAES